MKSQWGWAMKWGIINPNGFSLYKKKKKKLANACKHFYSISRCILVPEIKQLCFKLTFWGNNAWISDELYTCAHIYTTHSHRWKEQVCYSCVFKRDKCCWRVIPLRLISCCWKCSDETNHLGSLWRDKECWTVLLVKPTKEAEKINCMYCCLLLCN